MLWRRDLLEWDWKQGMEKYSLGGEKTEPGTYCMRMLQHILEQVSTCRPSHYCLHTILVVLGTRSLLQATPARPAELKGVGLVNGRGLGGSASLFAFPSLEQAQKVGSRKLSLSAHA